MFSSSLPLSLYFLPLLICLSIDRHPTDPSPLFNALSFSSSFLFCLLLREPDPPLPPFLFNFNTLPASRFAFLGVHDKPIGPLGSVDLFRGLCLGVPPLGVDKREHCRGLSLRFHFAHRSSLTRYSWGVWWFMKAEIPSWRTSRFCGSLSRSMPWGSTSRGG